MGRVFLLSPANCRGSRARRLVSPEADFPLARKLRSTGGAPLGEVFSFVSGLYFRGKLTYARHFAAPSDPRGLGVHVITPNAGLLSPDAPITRAELRTFARGDVNPADASYREPLEKSARVLSDEIGPGYEVVLLGSVATPKYIDVLAGIFAERLLFPIDFIGRGDMSRGSLLLRRKEEGTELAYAPVLRAVLRGARPPKLPRSARRAAWEVPTQ